jgi:RNA polymerase sigma factor (TIGR02999 family)
VATNLTRLLVEVAAGDAGAGDRLLPLVYETLKQIASQRMALERRDHTLGATALVNECYLRLVGKQANEFVSRAQFFHAAADAMRRILVEHARARGRTKRGGGRRRVPLNVLDLANESEPQEVLAFDEALAQLEAEMPATAEVVRLRFFAGLSVAETAEALGVSTRTVNREWTYARARLYSTLRTED